MGPRYSPVSSAARIRTVPARPEWLAIRTNPCWSRLEAAVTNGRSSDHTGSSQRLTCGKKSCNDP